ncbi:MAG TPA: glycosyl hydrolase family 28-related protein [Polyangiaceae bacterium]|nr:glycosyl hydrolase family 28-related protein [Polyangiaceae bacterium]
MRTSRHLSVLFYVLGFGALSGCGQSASESGDGSGAAASSAQGGDASGSSAAAGGSSAAVGGAQTAGASGSNSLGGVPNPGGAGGAGADPGLGGAPGGGMPSTIGATLNYLEYEAEDGETTGTVLGPARKTAAAFDIAVEASQRKAVQLSATGQYVRITSAQQANSIVVRFSVPDSADGQGQTATLSVYVNGTFRQKLNLSSRWSWAYGTSFVPKSSNNPADGNPHHYYDEAHALIGDIAANQTVTLQKDADDTAAFYVIDLIDLEQVPAPLAQPAGAISITDCGATPDDGSDDRAAIQTCITRAQGTSGGLFIPPGTFNISSRQAGNSAGLNVNNVIIRGAGMWYSTLFGAFANLSCTGSNCQYSDFAVFGDTVLRDDSAPDSNFSGPTGPGSSLTNIWMEHSKTGYWVGPNGNGLDIKGCRIRDLFADGVNFWGGTSNSIVEQTHFRNTGDDSMAAWSQTGNNRKVDSGNIFRFNTVQAPWMANCIGIYGGNDTKIEDNLCSDTVQYQGILIAQQFGSNPFGGTTSIQRNKLVRDGGFYVGSNPCALGIVASQGAVSGLLISDLQITDATYCGLQIAGANAVSSLTLQNIAITGSGTSGIQFTSNARGTGVASNVTVSNGGLDDRSKGAFVLTRQAGDTGW